MATAHESGDKYRMTGVHFELGTEENTIVFGRFPAEHEYTFDPGNTVDTPSETVAVTMTPEEELQLITLINEAPHIKAFIYETMAARIPGALPGEV